MHAGMIYLCIIYNTLEENWEENLIEIVLKHTQRKYFENTEKSIFT